MTGPQLEIVEVKEAARIYNVPVETIRTWIKRGKIQPFKQGRGRVGVRRDEIEGMLRFVPKASEPK